MKTIKFLHYAKYPVLIFIALLGIYIGGTQNVPRPYASDTSDIGGQRVPGTTIPVAFTEIGGQRIPNDPNPLGYAIGGGNNQNKPQVPDPLGILEPFHIVGESSLIGDNTPIGGQIPPRSGGMFPGKFGTISKGFTCFRVNNAVGIGGGQLPPHNRTDIGGNSAPRGFAVHSMEIGGNNQPGSETRNVAGSFPVNIGGQNQQVPKDSDPLGMKSKPSLSGDIDYPSVVTSYSEIGGNQGVPHTPLPFYLFDFADDLALVNLFDIGGEPAPRHLNDIGGGQLPPKTAANIGGNQSKPGSPSGDIGGGQLPPRESSDIGGNSAHRSYVFQSNDIGGNGNQGSKPTSPLDDIGGSQTPPRQ